MPLYKYVPLQRFDILTNRIIRFTQPGAFNDPFEMPVFLEAIFQPETFKQTLEERFPILLRNAYDALTRDQKRKLSFGDFSRLGKIKLENEFEEMLDVTNAQAPTIQAALKSMDRKIGVLSLTETCTNLLMWSHYADQHRGIVLEFDETHAVFDERKSDKDDFRYLLKVKYSDTRPNISLDNINFEDFLLTKSSEWAYEKEWRIIKPLTDSEKSITSDQYDIHLFSMPVAAVKKVIVGARVSGDEIEYIRNNLREDSELAHIKLQRAILNDRYFRTDIVDD